MICVPNQYKINQPGGYLLNYQKYHKGIFIDKKNYAFTSLLNSNIIYNMVNMISSTPFKINIELLNYIDDKGVEKGLIMDSSIPHKYATKKKLSNKGFCVI